MIGTATRGSAKLLALVALLFVIAAWPRAASAEPAADIVWREQLADGSVRVHLYVYWSSTCPHCAAARQDIAAIAADAPWLAVHERQVDDDPARAREYRELAQSLGTEARVVPGLAFCETLRQGHPGRDALQTELVRCRDEGRATDAAASATGDDTREVRIPGLGRVDMSSWSLPLATVLIAGLDAFNPCAFFVLLFLLSLLVHARSRARMLAIGGVFVAISGVWYFAFMAAWLNVFMWIGELRVVTAAAGVLALVLGAINVKDFIRPSVGPTLSIPESAKPKLFRRMRALVNSSSMWTMVAGTIVLAAAANSYELLCTAGFPMVYTRILTLHALGPAGYYGYLALYNVVYIIPLAAIVAVFAKTLGSRKLQEHEGRALKLLSGLMMIELGVVLAAAPQLLSDLFVSIGLFAVAGVVTLVAVRRKRAATQ